jgi:hypothetical protein
MQRLKEEVYKVGFAHERQDKAVKAIEQIFNLVATRDFDGMHLLTKTKLGSAMLDLAEVYGEFTEGSMADWHWSTNRDGEIIRYSRRFDPNQPIIPKDFK